MRNLYLVIALLLFTALAPAQIAVRGNTKVTGSAILTASGSGWQPQISSTSVQTISLTGAALAVTTNAPFYSPYSCTFNYGPTSSYGSSAGPTTNQIVGLTGLSQGATYHYDVTCSNGTSSATSPDATFTTLSSLPTPPARTVIDNEAGVVLLTPTPSYSALGAGVYEGYPTSAFSGISTQGLKINHGLFMMGGEYDQHNASWFPRNEMDAYNADETAAGNTSLEITATNGGSHYALIQTSDGNTCYNGKQLMFLSDPRYVRFFTQEYARKVLYSEVFPTVTTAPYYTSSWVGSDEGTFLYGSGGAYSMFPSGCTGSGVQPTAWDSPYPQNDSQMMGMITSFLYQVHQFAPDVHIILNEGSISNENLDNWANVYGALDGVDRESGPANGGFSTTYMLQDMPHYQWLASNGRVFLVRQATDNSTAQNENGAIWYALIRGGNSFFSLSQGTTQVAASSYTPIYDALGNPTANYTVDGNNVFSRTYQGGIVYFNADTSAAHNITLPSTLNGNTVSSWYLNNSGSAIAPGTSESVAPNTNADVATGICFTTQLGTVVPEPIYSPATVGKTITGPVSVTLSEPSYAPNGTSICYTTDGSAPAATSGAGGSCTHGTVYSAAFNLASSATVNAIAFSTSANTMTSFTKSASYAITSTQPTIQFANATDSATTFFPGTYATMVLSNPTARTVTVNYSVSGTAGVSFSPSSGSVTIPPYETVSNPYISVALNNGVAVNQTVTVRLTSATNATIGTGNTYTYTVLPYAASTTTKWAKFAPDAEANVYSTSASTPVNFSDMVYYTGVSSTNGSMRTLWHFNLSSIPGNATITSAQIKWYTPQIVDTGSGGTCTNNSGGFNFTLSAYRMTMNWLTVNSGTNGSGATWNNSGGNSSNYASSASDTDTNACPPSEDFPARQLDQYLDVTSDVQNIVNGANQNYGWVLIGPETATPNEYFEFYSGNYVDSNSNAISGAQVSLIVTYTVPQH